MFIVVFRHADQFRTVLSLDDARGIKPDEAWLFGTPMTRADWNILHCIDGAVALLPTERVHRIQ